MSNDANIDSIDNDKSEIDMDNEPQIKKWQHKWRKFTKLTNCNDERK